MRNILILLLLLLPSSLFGFNEMIAVQTLQDNGNFQHTVCEVKTAYANKGDHVLYKNVTPRDGMIILTDDGKCVKYNKNIIADRVVVAIVKSYT